MTQLSDSPRALRLSTLIALLMLGVGGATSSGPDPDAADSDASDQVASDGGAADGEASGVESGDAEGKASAETGEEGDEKKKDKPLIPPSVSQRAESADLQRRAAEGGAVEGGGDVEMTLAECEQLRMLGYVEDCSEAGAP